MDRSVIVAGAHLEAPAVAALARKLRDAGMSECADRMEGAYKDGAHLFHISTEERKAFIDALEDCPDELRQLHACLEDPLITEPTNAADPSAPTSSSSLRAGTTSL
jgi:hypothetical protein